MMNTREYTHFQFQTDARGVRTVTLNVPGRPMNVLNADVMSELEQIVSDLERANGVRVVVIRSGKESGFLAGADVHVIADIDSDQRAGELIDAGQKLFNRIENLPMPTIVVIHGVCLGGGLELSLACDYIIARNNSSTQIGLPEIKLGVIPGWGGTQRLPRRVGMSSALPMILKGDLLDARKASKIGLIDRAIDPQDWDVGVENFITEVLANKVAKHPHNRLPLWQRCLDHSRIGRWLIGRTAMKSIASKVQHYPALASAMKALSIGFHDRNTGLACEREEFVKLLQTPTSRNLLQLFFAREKARQLKTWSGDAVAAVHHEPIRKVAVVGAGAMGAGIGQLAAYRGFDVVIKEIDDAALAAGRGRIASLVDDLAKRKRMSDEQRNELLSKITFTLDDAALVDVDLVVEAVVERDDVKHKVFRSLDRVTKPQAILASNTSSLSVTRMAEATNRLSQVAGLHFFNPVHRMELVEVVRTDQTSDDCIARLITFVRALGKTPVVTSDSAGFLVNRVLFPYLGEAVLMVNEGYDVEQIDKEVRRFGMPMGPLELLDQVGLDVAHHVASSLDSILPGVAPVVVSLAAMVEKNNLGKKTGRGFYQYEKGKRSKSAMRARADIVSTPTAAVEDFRDDGLTPIQRRLVYPMLAESIRCYEEQVIAEPWAIDLAMVLGTGFAPHRGGPLSVVDCIGPEVVLTNLRRLQFYFGDRFSPPQRLVDVAEQRDGSFLGQRCPSIQ